MKMTTLGNRERTEQKLSNLVIKNIMSGMKVRNNKEKTSVVSAEAILDKDIRLENSRTFECDQESVAPDPFMKETVKRGLISVLIHAWQQAEPTGFQQSVDTRQIGSVPQAFKRSEFRTGKTTAKSDINSHQWDSLVLERNHRSRSEKIGTHIILELADQATSSTNT
ncbi:hypothetical protein BpHYR1_006542 [Brachionus plicatilis]|uniref:Uncharacterized protein n=1 Tax=Brachionus plicatilis TaxID=10195 RepID=A0A3M7T572_BRAPC|nr:hypothetical protein BpHYR1_006542 [Brachionus plicatilis]